MASDPSTPWHYDASQTALLLLDFHTYFVEELGGPKAQNAANMASQLRDWARSIGITVVHALLDINEKPSAILKGADRLGRIVDALKSKNDTGYTELIYGGSNADTDSIYYRTPGLISALSSPGLLEYLNGKGIKSLVLCGLSTSGCVLRTAIPATDAQFVVTIISDACADPDQATHDLLLDKILPSRSYIFSADEFKRSFKQHS